MKLEEILSAEAHFKKPVSYDPESQRIYDADNNFLLDVRGWGRLQYLTGGAQIQDNIGKYVCECINSANIDLFDIEK